jgi:hypothetical protein
MSFDLRQLTLRNIPLTQRDLVREFVAIFPASAYRIQALKRTAGARTRNYAAATPAELYKLVDSGTLAHANVHGSCIFARPVRRDLILIDDLPPHSIPTLRSLGLEPLAVIQSSPLKTNVVLHFPSIQHDNAPLHALVQRHIVETLIDLGLPADAGAARDMQIWRLPGFSNQKREEDGELKYKPTFFAAFLETNVGAVPRRADEFVERATAELAVAEERLSPTLQRLAEAQSIATTPSGTRMIASPEGYIAAIVNSMLDAKEGTRNWTLYKTSFSIFRFVHGCAGMPEYAAATGFEQRAIAAALGQAATAIGLGAHEIEGTIGSAWKRSASAAIFPDVVGLSN